MQQPADVVVRPAIKHVPRSAVSDAHERIVRCGLGIVPVSDAENLSEWQVLPRIAELSEAVVHDSDRNLSG